MRNETKKLIAAALAVIFYAAAAAIIIIYRDADNYEKQLETAAAHLEIHDYYNAIAVYNRVILEKEDCTEAYMGLYEAYSALDRSDKAAEVLGRGAEKAGNNEFFLNRLDELSRSGEEAFTDETD